MYLARYYPGLQWDPKNTATSTDRMRAHFMLGFTLYLIGTIRVDSEVQKPRSEKVQVSQDRTLIAQTPKGRDGYPKAPCQRLKNL